MKITLDENAVMPTRAHPCKDCKQECPTKGCKLWRRWWVTNWNQNICRQVPKNREKWQYEHPNLVREGIVFDPSR